MIRKFSVISEPQIYKKCGLTKVKFTCAMNIPFHVKWVPCHHSMLLLHIVDGEGLQIWRVAANILNMQL
jgi:hypothetical protein